MFSLSFEVNGMVLCSEKWCLLTYWSLQGISYKLPENEHHPSSWRLLWNTGDY